MGLQIKRWPAAVKGRFILFIAAFALMAQPMYGLISAQVARAVAEDSVVINEISPKKGNGEKWIELYNKSDSAVDISGWRFVRNTSTVVSPVLGDDVRIEPKSFYVYTTDKSLTSNASLLKLVDGPDGSVIDSVNYPTLENNSVYARTADGSGDFEVRAADSATRGASNVQKPELPPKPTVTVTVPTCENPFNVATFDMAEDTRIVFKDGENELRIRAEDATQPINVEAAAQEYNFDPSVAYGTELTGEAFFYDRSNQKEDISLGNVTIKLTDPASLECAPEDETPPEITFNNFSEGDRLNGTHPFKLSISDDSLKRYSYRIVRVTDDKVYPVNEVKTSSENLDNKTVYEWDTSEFGDGTYRIYASAVDEAENRIEKSITVYVDNTKPEITVKPDFVGSESAKVFSNVSFRLNDNDVLAKYRVNDWEHDVPATAQRHANFDLIKTHLKEGENTFTAYDRTGNEESYMFTYDATAPTLTVKNGETYVVGTDNRFSKVSFKLYDKYKVAKYSINGVEKAVTPNLWSDINFITPGKNSAVEGENTLKLYDVAGNITTKTFTLDSTVPQAEFRYSNDNGNAVTAEDVTVTLLVNEPIKTPSGWEKVNATTFEKRHSGNGKYTVAITDIAGNEKVANYEVKRIDRTAPKINGVESGAFYSDETVSFSVEEQSIRWITVDGVRFNEKSAPTSVSGEGSHTIMVEDKAGNKTTATFVIDTTAPEIGESDDANTAVSGEKTFTITQNEANPDRVYVELMRMTYNETKQEWEWQKIAGKETKNGNTAAVTVDTTKWSDEGEYQIKVSSRDKAGNTDGYSFPVVIKNGDATQAVPIFTINERSNDSRTVSGTVSSKNVVFRVKDGDKEVSVDETIESKAAKNGMYNWTFEIPNSVSSEGELMVTVGFNSQTFSEPKTVAYAFEASQVEKKGTTDKVDSDENVTVVNSGTDERDLTALTRALSQPFALPSNQNSNLVVASIFDGTTDLPQNDGSEDVLGAQSGANEGDTSSATTPITNVAATPSSSGWQIFGIAWYWWLTVVALLGAALWWALARNRGANEQYL